MPLLTYAPVGVEHLDTLAEILNHYILNTTFTFHQETLRGEDMKEKVFFAGSCYQAFIIEKEGDLVGYGAVSPWKKQESYRHTGEISIYLRHDCLGKGIGKQALGHLEDFARENQIHTLIAGICSENVQSRMLFEKGGYVQCAHFQGVGWKFGRKLDTVYFQKAIG